MTPEREERLLREIKEKGFLSIIMNIDDLRTKKDQSKQKLSRDIDRVRPSINELNKAVATCNEGDVIHNLKNIYTATAKINVISDLFPDDRQLRSLKAESLEILDTVAVTRDRLLRECECRNIQA